MIGLSRRRPRPERERIGARLFANRSQRLVGLCVVILTLHAAMLAWSAFRHSPTWNEVQHLAAGVSHWHFGQFDLYQVNPPLVRMVAALPVLAAAPKTDWRAYETAAERRAERPVGAAFLEANRARTFWLLTLGRWACIPFSLLGAVVCFRWAEQLYRPGAGAVALALWCFSPFILAHGPLVTPDVGATALGVAAAYLFWRWLRDRTWRAAFAAAAVLGLAVLARTTWIVLFALWPLLALAWRFPWRRASETQPWRRESAQVVLILVLGLYVVNLAYGFEGTCHRLGDYGFVSELLGGPQRNALPGRWERNRFAGTWLGRLPVPLPKNYLQGIDVQRHDFEQGTASYLRGVWADHGWWYYYLYALAVKMPLGTWWLVALALGATVLARGCSASWRDEMLVLAPSGMILILVSSQTGFSVHSRYVIPALPFLFVWVSKVIHVLRPGPPTRTRPVLATMAILAFTWSAGSSLAVYPHSLSYFNELVGGPSGGPKHLLDSNIDWGQDLLYLKRWLCQHPAVRLDGLAYWGYCPATLAGIPDTPSPPPDPECQRKGPDHPEDYVDLPPGWYALSVRYLYARSPEYRRFLRFEPLAMAGYSIYIYHVAPGEANRVP